MTRRSSGREALAPESWVEINPRDAAKLGVENGGKVVLVSRRGRVESTVAVTEGIKDGVVFMPFHYAESAANELTNSAFDPVAKIPEFKVCAVRVEKV
jgi:predicted molibdopterin-dependent oxidoreductase YjgC